MRGSRGIKTGVVVCNLLAAAGFVGGLWALDVISDPSSNDDRLYLARFTILYLSFCGLFAPLMAINLFVTRRLP